MDHRFDRLDAAVALLGNFMDQRLKRLEDSIAMLALDRK